MPHQHRRSRILSDGRAAALALGGNYLLGGRVNDENVSPILSLRTRRLGIAPRSETCYRFIRNGKLENCYLVGIRRGYYKQVRRNLGIVIHQNSRLTMT